MHPWTIVILWHLLLIKHGRSGSLATGNWRISTFLSIIAGNHVISYHFEAVSLLWPSTPPGSKRISEINFSPECRSTVHAFTWDDSRCPSNVQFTWKYPEDDGYMYWWAGSGLIVKCVSQKGKIKIPSNELFRYNMTNWVHYRKQLYEWNKCGTFYSSEHI